MCLGIYIHIPYCTRKCGYCSFNSYAFDRASSRTYLSALHTEIAGRRPEKAPDTLYIGGGTPTVLDAADIAGLVTAVRTVYGLAPDAEVSVEANPGTLEGYDIGTLLGCGIGRVSLGAQSFDADELRLLGRVHGPDEISSSVAMLRHAGVRNLNLDLIYAVPGQDMATWKRSLDSALSLGPEHMSLYCLSVDEGTPLHRTVSSGGLQTPPEGLQEDMYLYAVEALGKAGLHRYEMSNFAVPGHECRHNLNYWEAGDYMGLGAGAHSSIRGTRSVNLPAVGDYVAAVASGLPPVRETEALSRDDARKEFIMLSLRTARGLSFMGYAQRFGNDFMELYGDETTRLADAGYVSIDPEGIRLTDRGIFASNAVISEFF